MLNSAIIVSGGKQHLVTEGEILKLEKLEAEAGQSIAFDRVLMANTDGNTSIGTPTVDNMVVTAEVLEHGRGQKIRVFKFKRRKKYRRTIGHRQWFTRVKITAIKSIEA